MSSAVVTSALLVATVNAAAALVGAVRWWQVRPSASFWRVLRAGQALAVLFAAFAGVLALTGHRPRDGLFWLYALLPLAVSFVAEQLRLASAQTVLDARGLEDAQAVGRLPEDRQRAVVLAIVRREMGAMALAAGVVVFLALRAAGTADGF